MNLTKFGLALRLANPGVWRAPRPERMPTVEHQLFRDLRVPYPTAIVCRCGRTLYRFGTDLRHRDGTLCSVAKTKAA